MSKVAVDAHLINTVVEQLDFWRDSLESDEDKAYVTELIGDLESANSSASKSQYTVVSSSALSTVHELICEKEGYDCDDEQEKALKTVFG